MNLLCELFQMEFDDSEGVQESKVESGKRIDRSTKVLGRCIRCGSHIEEKTGHCSDCLGFEYCTCHHCAQIASILSGEENDLYWNVRNYGDDAFHNAISLGKSNFEAERWRAMCLQDLQERKKRITADLINYKSIKRPVGIYRCLNGIVWDKCKLSQELKQYIGIPPIIEKHYGGYNICYLGVSE